MESELGMGKKWYFMNINGGKLLVYLFFKLCCLFNMVID